MKTINKCIIISLVCMPFATISYGVKNTLPIPITQRKPHIQHAKVWESNLGGHQNIDKELTSFNLNDTSIKHGKQIQLLEYQKTIAVLKNDILKIQIEGKIMSAKADIAIRKANSNSYSNRKTNTKEIIINKPKPDIDFSFAPKLMGIFIKDKFKRASIQNDGKIMTIQVGQTIKGYMVKSINKYIVLLINKQGETIKLQQDMEI